MVFSNANSELVLNLPAQKCSVQIQKYLLTLSLGSHFKGVVFKSEMALNIDLPASVDLVSVVNKIVITIVRTTRSPVESVVAKK
ncbi:Hypothetical predicted protein [Octopus vulgaris]|uniref:Uncharacterized protein n=1 Tax=Octopus vulgaris TaxID=6645 RepID=A0AA36B117_OCTVU|nr:Hypothetical predicted protein [Octopus vulgaris]